MECRIIIMFRYNTYWVSRDKLLLMCVTVHFIFRYTISHPLCLCVYVSVFIILCMSRGVCDSRTLNMKHTQTHKNTNTYISAEWIISEMWMRAFLKYGNCQSKRSLYRLLHAFRRKLNQSRLSPHGKRLCLPKQNDGSLLIMYINCLRSCSLLKMMHTHTQHNTTRKGCLWRNKMRTKLMWEK